MTTETINITPTWAGVLPALVTIIRDGNPEAYRAAMTELQRMAQAADRLNAAAPDMLAALQFVLNDGNADLCAETAAIIQEAIDKATKTA